MKFLSLERKNKKFSCFWNLNRKMHKTTYRNQIKQNRFLNQIKHMSNSSKEISLLEVLNDELDNAKIQILENEVQVYQICIYH